MPPRTQTETSAVTSAVRRLVAAPLPVHGFWLPCLRLRGWAPLRVNRAVAARPPLAAMPRQIQTAARVPSARLVPIAVATYSRIGAARVPCAVAALPQAAAAPLVAGPEALWPVPAASFSKI